jgi:integrase
MRRAARFKTGSVVFDKRRRVWNLLTWEDGKRRTRRIGTLAEFPTKTKARYAAQTLMPVRQEPKPKTESIPTLNAIAEQYKTEKLPERINTKRTYLIWLKHYILPKWGGCILSDLQARPVELWIQSLELAPKSKAHVRSMIRTLWDYAMWSGSIPVQRNPMELVTVKGATKRLRKPRSLTVAEFQRFIAYLAEPFRTLAVVSVCFGLRISEALALKWSDVNWLNQTISIERRIVAQHVDATKTMESQGTMAVDPAVLDVLKLWKQTSQFAQPSDWIFASPTSFGRLPWSYAQVWDYYSYGSRDAGIEHVSTHVLRHTYRSWLDAAGTPITVQQKLMRHADIRTTLNVYGDVVTDEMAEAGSKVAKFALSGLQADCKPI